MWEEFGGVHQSLNMASRIFEEIPESEGDGFKDRMLFFRGVEGSLSVDEVFSNDNCFWDIEPNEFGRFITVLESKVSFIVKHRA